MSPGPRLGAYLRAILIGLGCVLVLRGLVVEAKRASSNTMAETILEGDHFMVLKAEFAPPIPFTSLRLPRLRNVQPQDVVVLRRPDHRRQEAVKRCVARGGQTVEIRQGHLHVDGVRQDEPYLRNGAGSGEDFGPYVVPAGRVFLLGDHRGGSVDSRVWGAVAEQEIEGRALFVYWSWDRERNRPRLDRLPRILD